MTCRPEALGRTSVSRPSSRQPARKSCRPAPSIAAMALSGVSAVTVPVSKARAATLMQTFGAELVGNQRTLPRTKLLQQLKKHRGRAAFRGEEERRARLVAELRKARITGIWGVSAGVSAPRRPRGRTARRGRHAFLGIRVAVACFVATLDL